MVEAAPGRPVGVLPDALWGTDPAAASGPCTTQLTKRPDREVGDEIILALNPYKEL